MDRSPPIHLEAAQRHRRGNHIYTSGQFREIGQRKRLISGLGKEARVPGDMPNMHRRNIELKPPICLKQRMAFFVSLSNIYSA